MLQLVRPELPDHIARRLRLVQPVLCLTQVGQVLGERRQRVDAPLRRLRLW
jgi:hypothetical protein